MKPPNFEAVLKRTNVRKIKPMTRVLNIGLSIGELIYPKGVGNFIRSRFFAPRCKSLTNDQEQWLKQAEEFKIPFKDDYIMAWKIGEGPTILFAHGWNGRGVQFSHFFEPALKAGYSVLFFDAPAHGKSGGETTNYLECTEALETIINHDISTDICGIIGHSLGAAAAINHRSEQVHDLPMVFVAPPFYLIEILFESFQMHGIPQRTYLRLVREVEQKYQLRLESKNPVDLINQIENQILIVHDTTDRTTPIEPSIAVAKTHKNVELFRTEGYGHSLVLRQGFVIEKALEFIRKTMPRRGVNQKLSKASA